MFDAHRRSCDAPALSPDDHLVRSVARRPETVATGDEGPGAAVTSVHGRVDPITGLAGPSTFARRLSHRLGAQLPVVVAQVDIDRLRLHEGRRGPTGSEGILRAVGARMVAAADGPDHVGRSQDGFVICLPEPAGGLAAAGWHLLDALDTPVRVGGRSLDVGVSVGVAGSAQVDGTAAELLRAADAAAREARSRGVRRVVVYDAARSQRADRARVLHRDLHRVVEHDELEVHYQPVVALPGGRLCGAEALVRWRHPVRGLVMPGEFIPEAERTGLIRRIGRAVLATACHDAAGWQDLAGFPVEVNVNLSAAELEDPRLLDQVRDSLRASGLSPSLLVLEVTETALGQDLEAVRAQLVALRGLGVRIAVDDFGSGYSSLDRLHQLEFDQLKLDRSLVGKVRSLEDPDALLRAAADLAVALGVEVVAEGVETPSQLAAVLRTGCARAQGFLLAPPVPVSDLRALLARPSTDVGLCRPA